MDELKIQIIDPEEFSEEWESFSIKDPKLTGKEWSNRYNELVNMLRIGFKPGCSV